VTFLMERLRSGDRPVQAGSGKFLILGVEEAIPLLSGPRFAVPSGERFVRYQWIQA